MVHSQHRIRLNHEDEPLRGSCRDEPLEHSPKHSQCPEWAWDCGLFVVQLLSSVRLFATPWNAASQAPLSFTVSQSLFIFTSISFVMLSHHLIPCHPLLLLTSFFPSIRVFSKESALPIRWPKYWHFSFSTSCSNEYSGLISFRMDCFDLAVQGTLKSLLQHHNLKAFLQHSALFMVQLLADIY